MPLFTVAEEGVEKPRLIEAKSREAARAFVLGARFKVEIVTKPAEVAKLYAAGVTLEDSTKPPVQEEEQQQERQEGDNAGGGEDQDGNQGDGKEGPQEPAGDGAAPPARSPRGGKQPNPPTE